MKLSFIAPLFIFLATSCAAPVPLEEIMVLNVGSEVSFLRAFDGSGILVGLQEEIDGEMVALTPSLSSLCTQKCSAPPGPSVVACADAAPDLLVAHALLPGESVSRSFDEEFWYRSETRGCAKRAPLTGALAVRLCHDDAVVDANGEPLAEPTESGPMGSATEEVLLNEANCEVFPVELVAGLVVVEVAE